MPSAGDPKNGPELCGTQDAYKEAASLMNFKTLRQTFLEYSLPLHLIRLPSVPSVVLHIISTVVIGCVFPLLNT